MQRIRGADEDAERATDAVPGPATAAAGLPCRGNRPAGADAVAAAGAAPLIDLRQLDHGHVSRATPIQAATTSSKASPAGEGPGPSSPPGPRPARSATGWSLSATITTADSGAERREPALQEVEFALQVAAQPDDQDGRAPRRAAAADRARPGAARAATMRAAGTAAAAAPPAGRRNRRRSPEVDASSAPPSGIPGPGSSPSASSIPSAPCASAAGRDRSPAVRRRGAVARPRGAAPADQPAFHLLQRLLERHGPGGAVAARIFVVAAGQVGGQVAASMRSTAPAPGCPPDPASSARLPGQAMRRSTSQAAGVSHAAATRPGVQPRQHPLDQGGRSSRRRRSGGTSSVNPQQPGQVLAAAAGPDVLLGRTAAPGEESRPALPAASRIASATRTAAAGRRAAGGGLAEIDGRPGRPRAGRRRAGRRRRVAGGSRRQSSAPKVSRGRGPGSG